MRHPRDIGGYARERREHFGILPTELARRICVSREWIVRFENGNTGANLASVTRLYNALGIAFLGASSAHPRHR
jgi:HTH-type transcriptional regulator/antitoxin HipB